MCQEYFKGFMYVSICTAHANTMIHNFKAAHILSYALHYKLGK